MDRLQLDRMQQQALADEAIEAGESFIDAVPGYYARYSIGGERLSITEVTASLAYTDQRVVFVGPEHTVSCDFAVIDGLDLEQEDTFVATKWEAEAGTVEVDWRSERGAKIAEFFESMMATCNTRREAEEAAEVSVTDVESADIDVPLDTFEDTDIICLSALESDTMEFEQFAVAFKFGADQYQLTGVDGVLSWAAVYSHGVQVAADKGGELMLTVMDPRDDW